MRPCSKWRARVAERFLDAVRRTATEDDEVDIQPVDGKPRDEARRHRRDNARPTLAPKPYRAPAARADHAKPGVRRRVASRRSRVLAKARLARKARGTRSLGLGVDSDR